MLTQDTKAIIIALILFALALWNFLSIPEKVLQKMKDRLNSSKHNIYDIVSMEESLTNNTNNRQQQLGGGLSNFTFLQNNPPLSPWDQKPNTWAPNRLYDLFVPNDQKVKVYQGHGIPLKTDEMCNDDYPSDVKSMFYFKDNISAPECCPGPYSSDSGCVCSFEKASF